MKIVLDVGHTASEPGACNSTYDVCEFEFNRVLTDAVCAQAQFSFNSFIKKYDIELVKVFRDNYRDLPQKINKENPDVVISFHANAFNTKASGTETLYYFTSEKSKSMALILQEAILGALSLNNRGIKAIMPKGRGFYLLSKTKAPCVTLEPFFIDNNFDFEVANKSINTLASAILEAIIKIYERSDIWRI